MGDIGKDDTLLFFVDPKLQKVSLERPAIPVPDRQSERWVSENTESFAVDPYANLAKLVQPVKDMKTSRTGVKFWLLSFPGHTETRIIEEYLEKNKLRGAAMKEVTDLIESDYDVFRNRLPIVAFGDILAERNGRYVPFVNKKGRRWEIGKLRYDLTEWSSDFSFLAFAR